MASSKEYLDFILDQLSELDDVSYRAMMGEYIFYYRGKIVGGIYDDRFLVKPTKSAAAMMPNADLELPYEGAKEMLLVEDVDNKEFLRELLDAMYNELPAAKKKRVEEAGTDLNEQMERIQKYEDLMWEAEAALKKGRNGKRFRQVVKELEAYYASNEWKEDFAADEEGRLPKTLKRGVLSEDGLYNLLELCRERMEE